MTKAQERMTAPSIKLILVSPGFFAIPPKKLKVETDPNINRTLFIHADRVVAVGTNDQTQGDVR